MIQITQGGVSIANGAVERLRDDYQKTGLAMMPGFLAPPVVKSLLTSVGRSRFEAKREPNVVGKTMLMPAHQPALTALHFMLNRRELFEAVAAITGIPTPGNYTSRLHRTRFDPEQHIDWHDDAIDHRVLGMNINLSEEPYSGGLLQLRDPSKKLCGTVGQLPPGDAFLFRIGDRWQHRLTPIESGLRTVAVGWFRSRPDWHTLMSASFRTQTLLAASIR